MRSNLPRVLVLGVATAMGAAACDGTIGDGAVGAANAGGQDGGGSVDGGLGGGEAGDVDGGGGVPFEAFSVSAYVAKVKNTLVGLPPTADEVVQVKADPKALASLIDRWMTLPQYRTQMLSFFANAFQQTQVHAEQFQFQIPDGVANGEPALTLLMNALRESFARTVMQLVDEGRPFSDAVTTRRFMLTPPLLALYGYVDAVQFADDGMALPQGVPADFHITITNSGPIPIEQSLDPASPKYMTFFHDNLSYAANNPGVALSRADARG